MPSPDHQEPTLCVCGRACSARFPSWSHTLRVLLCVLLSLSTAFSGSAHVVASVRASFRGLRDAPMCGGNTVLFICLFANEMTFGWFPPLAAVNYAAVNTDVQGFVWMNILISLSGHLGVESELYRKPYVFQSAA